MYRYRRMTREQRQACVDHRRDRGFPWHSPPHPEAPGEYRIVTATCFEHAHLLDTSDRLQWFENELLTTLKECGTPCAAWCVLPNHYHLLVGIVSMSSFSRELGRLHGRTSRALNLRDNTAGRRVWFRCQDRCMRSERHFYASLNYIHHNPVKHGYVERWQDWPFSSADWYLAMKGRDWLVDVWRNYPVRDYGAKWDDFAGMKKGS